MTQVVLFVLALFAAPWIVDWILSFLLPPSSGDLSSFLARFVPSIWMPTVIALLFVGIADGAAGVRDELRPVLATGATRVDGSSSRASCQCLRCWLQS